MILFILLVLFCFFMLIIRNGAVGVIIVGAIWFLAWTFNPNIDSGFVWLLAFGLGYLSWEEPT